MLHSKVALGSELLNIRAQYSYLLLQVILEVEPVLLSKPQLAEVVVERLLRYAYNLGGLLKVDLVFMLVESVMYLPPLLYVLQDLPDRSLAISLPLAFARGF